MHGTDDIPQEGGAFAARIARYAALCLARWEQAPETAPDSLPRHSAARQSGKQREFEALFNKLPVSQERYESLAAGERARARSHLRNWIARSVAPGGGEPVDEFFEQCERVADEFVARAREFDPVLPDGDVHQALRNQWVFNSLQAFCGRPVSLTPSSFAYSMLYPLTDNALDAPGRSVEERDALVRWLSSRLSGDLTGEHPERRHPAIAALLDMIDGEYPRSGYPDAHRSLLAIHDAQKKALSLDDAPGQFPESDLLLMTIEKGGTSVLADGYLAGGELDRFQEEAFFGYGVLLQLIDDLQDLDEDLAHSHSTPFTRGGAGTALERRTNRLLNFAKAECTRLSGLGASPWLPPVIEQSCLSLIFEAIARYRRSFGPAYLRMIGPCMPVPLEYLAGLRKRMDRQLAGRPPVAVS